MRVWRIEAQHDGACGVYALNEVGVQAYRYTRRAASAPDYKEHHANPFYDKGLKSCPYVSRALGVVHPLMHCGFKDIEQLHKWFPPSRLCDMQHEAGHIVHLAEYEVPEEFVQLGEKQVLFPLVKASRVANHPVNEFSVDCPDPDRD